MLADSEATDNLLQTIASAIVRVHQHGAMRKEEFIQNGIGSSGGGLKTYIHTCANAGGLPVDFHVTPVKLPT